MGKKGRANKNNTPVVKHVEEEVPKEEPVPEPPKEPELSLGEKKLLKQREKEQREEQERLKREAEAAQLLKQESKAKKSKSKTQKIKLNRTFSESSQQSSSEKVTQDTELKVPSGQIEKISLKEEIQVKEEPEPMQSSQNMYKDQSSLDSSFPDNTTMKYETSDWANDTDEHCNQFNASPSKTESDTFYQDNRPQYRDNRGSRRGSNTYYNSNRQPSSEGSTSNFQQDRGSYRGGFKNPRGDAGHRNDNRYNRDRGNDNRDSNYKSRGFSNSLRNSDRGRGNDDRDSNKTRGFSNSNRNSDSAGGYNRDNRSGNSQNFNSRGHQRQYDSRPPKSNYWVDRNKPKQENWDESVQVGNWEEQPQSNTESQQQNVAAVTQHDISYTGPAQENYEHTQADSTGYMNTETCPQSEETGNVNYSIPAQNYSEVQNTSTSEYQVSSDDSHWEAQTTANQSQLDTSGAEQELNSAFPELPQSQGMPPYSQSDDQKTSSNQSDDQKTYRNQSGNDRWQESNRTPRTPYNNNRDRNQPYEQNSGRYSMDKKRKNESFNSSADSSFNRSDYNSSYNKRDSYSRFSGDDRSPRYGYNKYRNAERRDMEYSEFNKLCCRDRPINYGKLREETGDLFLAPVEYSLAHCVAEDMSMGAGIAKTFRMKFGRVANLLDQGAKTGGLAVLEDGKRFIYYLVTKERSQGKPTMYTLWLSLKKLKDHCIEHGVKKLAIPQIGCGLDRLIWSEVKQLLEYVFKDVDIEIVVYTLEGDVEDRKVKKSFINHQKLSLVDIESGTGHIYFGYCDGTVTDDITSLSSKFSILPAYKSNKREIGDVIRTQEKIDIAYGIIIKQSPKDKFSFVQLEKGLRQLNKFIKKDEYNYVGFQAFVDENDEQIIDKITTIMQYALKDVEIWVCWPKDIEKYCPVQPNRD